jgi:hypothetical protein
MNYKKGKNLKVLPLASAKESGTGTYVSIVKTENCLFKLESVSLSEAAREILAIKASASADFGQHGISKVFIDVEGIAGEPGLLNALAEEANRGGNPNN